MEAMYSSVPEIRNPVKIAVVVTISAIVFTTVLWW